MGSLLLCHYMLGGGNILWYNKWPRLFPVAPAFGKKSSLQLLSLLSDEICLLDDLILSLASEIADVGHVCAHAPQDTHEESPNNISLSVVILDSNPLPVIVSVNCPCTSSHARTHLEQFIHFERSILM